MSAAWWNRKIHYWLSLAIALPTLLMLTTGVVLHMKKRSAWIQPPEHRGSTPLTERMVTLPQLLSVCRTVPEAGVQEWEDITRVDFRPKRGLIKVITKKDWEIQVNAETGAVLQTAYRRSDVIEAMHDGSWFHDLAKDFLFLPSGVALLLLWITGMYLFALPIWVRARKKRAKLQR